MAATTQVTIILRFSSVFVQSVLHRCRFVSVGYLVVVENR